MSKVPAALKAHLDRDITTLCHCWRLVRQDGSVFGFTDHDLPLSVDGTLYEPESGLAASEARQSLGLANDAMDVAGALTSDRIRDADIDAGHYDRAEVETLLVNWRDPAAFMTIRKAVIGTISRRDGRFTAELESPLQALDQPNGRYFRRTCDAELGDTACGFDLSQAGFNGAGTVTSVNANGIVEAAGLDGFSAQWFADGQLSWSGGANAGRSQRVISHETGESGAILTLHGDGCAAPSTGDPFTITAGCDKRFATCKVKFANALNFRGFPHLPGNDAAYAYARPGQTFDGGPLVP